jgi:twitching motility protein PilT
MERLNDYLQKLLSSCSDELHLEPNKNPYLIAANRTSDLGQVPLLGTQISTMVFPIIPPDAKMKLPSSSEIEFLYPNNLGNFNFTVQKSPAGFVVTVRPVIDDKARGTANTQQLPPEPPLQVGHTAERSTPFADMPLSPLPEPTFDAIGELPKYDPAPAYVPETGVPSYDQISYELESSSSSYDGNSSLEISSELSDLLEQPQPAPEYIPAGAPEIELTSANDPSFQTLFSTTAPDPPLRRRSDFVETEHAPPAEPDLKIEFSAPPNLNMEYHPTVPAPPVAPAAPEPSTVEDFSAQAIAAPAPVAQRAEAYVTQPPAEAAFVPQPANSTMAARMDVYFHAMAEMGASDLHLSVSMPPMIRKDGKMRPMNGDSALSADAMRELLVSIMPAKNQEEFAQRHDTDFAYEIPGLARFRCNVFQDRKGMGAVFRIIPTKILTAQDLGLSKAIMDLCSLSKGLVVVTGPTGSGKSTTLCAMVDHINKSREDHIITIEDPIEFVHDNQKCLVNQREVHNHTDSFKDALRAALREDPDILLVGEMRDLETIAIAIETAETGHLVFGTLHTTTAASTVDRIIDQFPADRQQQIRVMLSESLKGVIAQTLLPKKGGGRVAALEVLIVTPAISNLIREGKTFQIPSAMQTGRNHGMVMLNDSLFEHVQAGRVEPLDAYIKAVDKTGFETQLTRAGLKI